MDYSRLIETLRKVINFISNVIQIVLRHDGSNHQFDVKEHP
jgi:hypothetical protein